MSSVSLVPATEEMIREFYGSNPPRTVRAIAGVRDGEVLGVGGYYILGRRVFVFSDIKPEAMKEKKAIVRATKIVLGMVRKSGIPGMAIADDGIEGAEKFLSRIGFEKQPSGVYEWQS
jgi:hypothetical protein